MPLPRPIRFDADTWLVMRNDPILRKAVIQRVHHKDGGDRYLLFRWDLDPATRSIRRTLSCGSIRRRPTQRIPARRTAPGDAEKGPRPTR